ncbi:peptidoglycan DD-metalloendopeptidase family protein [Sphingobium subterraneum]|uniref:M23 family metallopeptidase n=1 Tax=Sphingobium subterraneum TaxID=627688 RepID=UPI003CCE2D75
MRHSTKKAAVAAWLRMLFAEREIFLRSDGKVRFVRITSRMQVLAAAIVGAALLVWAAATLAMAWNQLLVSGERAAMDAKARTISAQATKVDAYKRSVGDIAADLDRRQDMLDDMVRSQFGGAGWKGAVVGKDDQGAPAAPKDAPKKISSALPGAPQLRALEVRQSHFARQLAALVDTRAAKVEAAIRSFGLDPAQIAARTAKQAQGGPYIPWNTASQDNDPAFLSLAASLARLNALEFGLVSIPSGQPTGSPMLTSSYGYRSDPFTGAPAFHAGVDFPGIYGQSILAAAAGRVSYVGGRQGYGNVVEVDHGNGIMTRYAHLSRFGVRVGQDVARGQAIARMGSTGRSTGTHLHFEVRVNGAPINPRRFLEARQDVLQVQQVAKSRIANVRIRNVGA